MTLKPGDCVAHFVIVSRLGAGGMGEVYLARDQRLQRSVALKIVQPEGPAEDSGRASSGAARLIREAQAAAALEHPNVVTIFEVGEIPQPGGAPPVPFIAMELVKGKALRAYVGDESVPMKERIRWLTDMGRALAAAHEIGLVHRDVKPENVMIREDGVVRVLDFGLAKRAAAPLSSSSSTEAQVLPSLTGKGVAIGTPYYMAPEQMRREALDGRADEFAWGVVAYELLSGVPPWGTDIDALELISKLFSESPRPLHELRADIPAHVAHAVMRTMEKDKKNRFATMKELVETLEGTAFAPTMPRIPVPEASRPPLTDGDPALPHQRTVSFSAETRSAPIIAPVPADERPRRRGWLYSVAGVTVIAGAVAARALTTSAPQVVAPAPPTTRAPPRECTASTECVRKNGGKPFVCNRQGACAAIETPACKAMYEPGDLARDDTIWVGAMFPLSGARKSYGESNMNAVELARRDFTEASRSLPVRPIAVVGCDDATAYEAIARHLVDEIGAPAVLGFGTSTETVELATSLFVPRGVLTLATLSLSPLLSRIPQRPDLPRMVLRTTYSNAEAAQALAALVARLEPRIHASSLRVALARMKTSNSGAFGEALFSSLRFNGKSALDNRGLYREFGVANDEKAEIERVARDIAAFRADIVIVAAPSELLASIEGALPSNARKPYFLSDTILDPEMLRFLGTDRSRRKRTFGVTSVSTTLANARFVVHYNETFAEPITRTWAPNTSYDAFYVLAYAAVAAPTNGTVEGVALASAVRRLMPPGRPIDVGQSGILDACGALARGEAIDLDGASGSLDFDFRTGDAPASLAVICADVDESGKAVDGVESGLVFDGATKEFVGEMRCP